VLAVRVHSDLLAAEHLPAAARKHGVWSHRDAMLSHTSTPWAPWSVVPADHKWFTRLATAAILVTAMHTINPRYPAAAPAQREQMAQVRNDFEAELGSSREP